MNMIHVIFLCFQLLLFSIPSSSNVTSFTPLPSFSSSGPSCFDNERLALLQMKKDFTSSYGPSDSSLLSSWKPSTNCCSSWEGVTCDKLTGHVIGLDLSGYGLSGLINSTLFLQLSHLQQLSLADNNFQLSPIPSRLDLLPNLTHLNLSNSIFSGQVPLELSRLPNLVSLDLSCYYLGDYLGLLKLEDPNLQVLVTDLHNLRELYLDGVNISANGSDWCSSLPLAVPKLQVLSLSYTHLSGPICKSLQQLQLLSTLHLNGNNFSSEMPKKIMLLPDLRSLDVSENRLLSGTLPKFPKNSVLEFLSLHYTSFYGQLPDSISNLKLLKELDLSDCNFSGLIPYSLANLSQVTDIDLSSNHFQGWLPFLQPTKNGTTINASNHHSFLQSLEFLSIDNNSMEATLDPSMFTLPSLRKLYLSQNLLSGALKTFHAASSSLLEILDLSSNNLEGQIPNSIFQLQHLNDLQLFSNNFSGMVDAGLFKNLKSLQTLDLSHNKKLLISDSSNSSLPKLKMLLLNSCNISEFPHFLRNQVDLYGLDLSDNKIHGQIPNWIWHESLVYLNLSHNFLIGMQTPVPSNYSSSLALLDISSNQLEGAFPDLPPSINFLSLSKNKLSGEMPLSICNMSWLPFLDLSDNQLRGQVPKCLEITSEVMSLRGNHFHGTLSWNFSVECSLKTLDIYRNKLEGKVPRSLINCKELEVVDLGDNQINDTFPSWMGNLPNLQVLILQANKFHGPINQHLKKEDFPMLHILDLSSNSFTGNLPNISWMSMMQKSQEDNLYVEKFSSTGGFFEDRMSITNKGIKMEEIRILTIFNVLDLSNNQFQGQIPEVMGNLEQLQVLNLSRNNLMGQIPSFLAKLSLLESLDLSGNKLSGEIPSQLTNLTFLEVLDLSYNQLVGRIPLGNQFSTFNNDSYKGNLGLCGSPLSRQCDDGKKNTSRTAEEGNGSDSVIPIDWKFVVVGYGFGAVVAATINFIMLSRCKVYAAWIERVFGGRRARRNRGRRGGRTRR